MRSEEEIMNLILNTAKNDERVRAVYMEGSRVNKNAPKDMFQDYDIVYVVKETKSFIDNKNWINIFGKILFMQYPDENVMYESDKENNYGYLMQFEDGNRIDLHVSTLNYVLDKLKGGKLYKVLLDKDNCLPKNEKLVSDKHIVKKPDNKEFLCVCNEFWWCLDNVAKGLFREEITYVMDMINYNVRPCLFKILSWEAGMNNSFSISVGKSGKYLYKYISEKVYSEYLKTYSSGNINSIWDSVIIMCNLFNKEALKVSKELGFVYNNKEADNSFNYLMHVKSLKEDATEI